MAKCFANLYKPVVYRSWCYAVHCRGGYELPTHILGAPAGGPSISDLKEIHEFASYFEQEVAVGGDIYWDQIVGFRRVKCDKRGQFFSGPVYLREPRFWKAIGEEGAFDALFELMSGKRQSPRTDPKIFRSYVQNSADRWDLIPNVNNA
jgi:hypothetical protein